MATVFGRFRTLTSTFSVELPGIEPELLLGKMHSELLLRSAWFHFGPARYLRFRFRVLTGVKEPCPATLCRRADIPAEQLTAADRFMTPLRTGVNF